MSITLHPKLGVNPRLVNYLCPICGKIEGGEIVLLGISNYRDKCPSCGVWMYGGRKGGCPKCKCSETDSGWTRETLKDDEKIESVGICKECKKMKELGIIFISVRDGEEGENPYRTGKVCVLKEEAVKRFVTNPTVLERVLKSRVTFIPEATWKLLGLPSEASKEGNENAKCE